MKFGVVNKTTILNRFVFHTLQRNITHLAVIKRKTNIKLDILKGGEKLEKSPNLSILSWDRQFSLIGKRWLSLRKFGILFMCSWLIHKFLHTFFSWLGRTIGIFKIPLWYEQSCISSSFKLQNIFTTWSKQSTCENQFWLLNIKEQDCSHQDWKLSCFECTLKTGKREFFWFFFSAYYQFLQKASRSKKIFCWS